MGVHGDLGSSEVVVAVESTGNLWILKTRFIAEARVKMDKANFCGRNGWTLTALARFSVGAQYMEG